MLRFVLLAVLLAAGSAFGQDPPAAAAPAGLIDFAEGDATLENAGVARLAKEGDAVREGETLTTFQNAEVHLKMADGAYLSVRENTKITITRYRANGDDTDESLVDLARGAMRTVTGWIGKYRRAACQVRTPMVTIGVRGTDHEVTHLLDGDPRGDPGTYDKVNEGATFMQSPKGTVEVQPNRAAWFHTTRTPAPRLLAEVPRFFRPAAHEARFTERARASAARLDDARNARRKLRGLPPQARPAAAAERRAAFQAQRAARGPAAGQQERRQSLRNEKKAERRRVERERRAAPHPRREERR